MTTLPAKASAMLADHKLTARTSLSPLWGCNAPFPLSHGLRDGV
jgi:hypothetical protein